MVFEQVGQGI